jgi:large subunit ribosomal protein L33
MAKAPKETNFLISSDGSGYFYANRKNKRKSKGENKIKLRKYDPRARKHVLFEEKKLSALKKRYKPGQAAAAEAAKAEGGKSKAKGGKAKPAADAAASAE